jgi:hypothetical protein
MVVILTKTVLSVDEINNVMMTRADKSSKHLRLSMHFLEVQKDFFSFPPLNYVPAQNTNKN